MGAMSSDVYADLMGAVEGMSAACAHATEDFTVRQLTLSGNLFIQALNVAVDELNARTFRDVQFSFRDLKTSIVDNGMEEPFALFLETLEGGVRQLELTAALPSSIRNQAEQLKARLEERRRANERATFRPPDAPEEPLPHDPSTLTPQAEVLRHELQAAGFETPVMDELATNPESFEIRDCTYLIDEIDGILA